MNRTLKLISVLLSYPEPNLSTVREEFHAAVAADSLLPRGDRVLLDTLIDELCGLDTLEAQERYVRLFDRTRSLSLHLFEHVHGESRDRGQAMVDLAQTYEANGFTIDARELPDYLPLFLEFLSTQPRAEAIDLLAQTGHILAGLRERLLKRDSNYAKAILVLEAMAHEAHQAIPPTPSLEVEDDDPDDLVALDKVWEEEAVTFGNNAGEGACGPDRIQRQIRAGRRPPPPPPTFAGER